MIIALWSLQQAWLDAWRTQGTLAAPVAGMSVEDYDAAARGYRMRADIDMAIIDAYTELGYGAFAWDQFWDDKGRMDDAARLCRVYIDARREQVAAEAERERLLVEWAALPVAERKSSHPIFCARVSCCERMRRSQLLLT